MKDFQFIPLFDSSFKQNPHSIYQRLLSQSPIHHVLFPGGVAGWVVTGYDAAIKTLSHPDLGKNQELGNPRWRAFSSIMPEPQHSRLQAHLLHQDPPRHAAMRGLITSTFAPARIAGFRGRILHHVNTLLDPICAQNKAELIGQFAAKLPLLVISEVIGLSDQLRDRFKPEWRKALGPVNTVTDAERCSYLNGLVELYAYIGSIIEESRGGSTDSLVVRLIAAHDAEQLDYNELTSMLFQLLIAGQESVTNQIGNAVLALLQNPDQMQKLVKNPVLKPAAITELLRYNSAFELSTWRFASKPTNLFGAQIPAGDAVVVSFNAANRDPARFECPHKLKLDRSHNEPLVFGHDHHRCPAEALARLELEISLQQIITRLPNLRLACHPQQLHWTPAVLARGLCQLPVLFGPVQKVK